MTIVDDVFVAADDWSSNIQQTRLFNEMKPKYRDILGKSERCMPSTSCTN